VSRATLLLGAVVVALAPTGARAESDPKAMAVCDELMNAMGGEQAWEQTRYLHFDWVVERGGEVVVARSHWWDRWTGDYRLEGTDDGTPFVVAMNINSKEGRAWSGGEELQGEALAKKLEAGFSAWTNDTYWLIMPYKLRDPGVSVSLEGQEEGDGGAWNKLALSFEGVGLTPKDRYWVYVNRETGLVDRWDYVLKGGDDPPTSWKWEEWTRVGGIMLPRERHTLDGEARIHFPVMEAPASMPEGWLTSGEPLAP